MTVVLVSAEPSTSMPSGMVRCALGVLVQAVGGVGHGVCAACLPREYGPLGLMLMDSYLLQLIH